jgi:sigma-B regulation protein RsbU (phosphoserine phosphatase)
VELREGDRLVLFTDGISEAANADGELYSDERLAQFVAALPVALTAQGITEQVLAEIERHLGSEEAQDDRTLVVLRVTEPSAAPVHNPLSQQEVSVR